MQDRIARLLSDLVLRYQVRDALGLIEFSVNQGVRRLVPHQHRGSRFRRRRDRVATTSGAKLGSWSRVCILCRVRFLESCRRAGSALRTAVRFPKRAVKVERWFCLELCFLLWQ